MPSLGFHFPGVGTDALGQRLLTKAEGKSCSFHCGIEGRTFPDTFPQSVDLCKHTVPYVLSFPGQQRIARASCYFRSVLKVCPFILFVLLKYAPASIPLPNFAEELVKIRLLSIKITQLLSSSLKVNQILL